MDVKKRVELRAAFTGDRPHPAGQVSGGGRGMRRDLTLVLSVGPSAAPDSAPAVAGSRAAAQLRLTTSPVVPPLETLRFLLETAAEIEHALMVQYLYAAWSLPRSAPGPTAYWRDRLMEVARAEMTHLAAVQNVIRFVGGRPNLERQDLPFRTELYPFPLRLEPLSRGSLARYVAAEMPAQPDVDPELLAAVISDSGATTGGLPINRVGALYQSILELISDPERIPDADLGQPPSADTQLPPSRWRADVGFGPAYLRPLGSRGAAVDLLIDIARQGEGEEVGTDSHYLVFLDAYEQWDELARHVRSLPVNPTVSESPPAGLPSEPITVIRNPRTRRWAELADGLYHQVLQWLAHALDAPPGPDPASALALRTFASMLALAEVADLLTTLPREANARRDPAGPPLALPAQLTPPTDEPARWRAHSELLAAAERVLDGLSGGSARERAVATHLRATFAATRAVITPHIPG